MAGLIWLWQNTGETVNVAVDIIPIMGLTTVIPNFGVDHTNSILSTTSTQYSGGSITYSSTIQTYGGVGSGRPYPVPTFGNELFNQVPMLLSAKLSSPTGVITKSNASFTSTSTPYSSASVQYSSSSQVYGGVDRAQDTAPIFI